MAWPMVMPSMMTAKFSLGLRLQNAASYRNGSESDEIKISGITPRHSKSLA
jgi:hypothetical protein